MGTTSPGTHPRDDDPANRMGDHAPTPPGGSPARSTGRGQAVPAQPERPATAPAAGPKGLASASTSEAPRSLPASSMRRGGSSARRSGPRPAAIPVPWKQVIVELVEELGAGHRIGSRGDRRRRLDGPRRRHSPVQSAPGLAQRAAAGQPAAAAAPPGAAGQRRRRGGLGRMALRRRPGREPAGLHHPGHRNRRGHGDGRAAGTRRFGVAGEFGHQIIMPGGHRCECGNRGCWEQYASGNALGREARELAAANSPVAQELLKAVGGDGRTDHRCDGHGTGQGRGPGLPRTARRGGGMAGARAGQPRRRPGPGHVRHRRRALRRRRAARRAGAEGLREEPDRARLPSRGAASSWPPWGPTPA